MKQLQFTKRESMSAKVQVIFYSMYGHVYKMAEAVVTGARDAGAQVQLYQVAELVPDETLERMGATAARQVFAHIPMAKPEQMTEADAIIFLAHPHASATCARRCAISLTRPANSGSKEVWWAK
jgi:NAD(P)H dehydrogenase (quinone)